MSGPEPQKGAPRMQEVRIPEGTSRDEIERMLEEASYGDSFRTTGEYIVDVEITPTGSKTYRVYGGLGTFRNYPDAETPADLLAQ